MIQSTNYDALFAALDKWTLSEIDEVMRIKGQMRASGVEDLRVNSAFSQYFQKITRGDFETVLEITKKYGREITSLSLPAISLNSDEKVAELLHYCPTLYSVVFVYSKIADKSFAALESCPELALLKIENLTNARLARLVETHPKLIDLTLWNNEELTDEGFHSLTQLTGLTRLELNDCDISDGTLVRVLRSLKALTDLEINGCRKLTRVAFLEMAKNSGLRTLKLMKSDAVDQEVIGKLATHLTNLTQLDVRSCYNVRDEAVVPLSLLPKLARLDLMGCSLTDDVVDHINCISGLQYLMVDQLSDEGLARLTSPQLKTAGGMSVPEFIQLRKQMNAQRELEEKKNEKKLGEDLCKKAQEFAEFWECLTMGREDKIN